MHCVLVHGAWHGPWCWHKVIPHLQAAGHNTSAPELPLADGMDAYVEVVCGEVSRAGEPVVLVGHSLAGAVVSLVAEAMPDAIERLVFLAAFAGSSGESVNALAGRSLASGLRGNMEIRDDGLSVVKEKYIPAIFYHDCDEEDVELAMSNLRPQGTAAFNAPITVTAERFGRVPKQYIECVEDQAINIALQREMARNIGCFHVNTMNTSHSPFFSAPAALAALIATIGIKDTRK